MGMAETIFTATTASDYNTFGELVRELVGWYRTRYAHDKWFVEAACSHQSLDAELEALPRSYGPPNGKCTHVLLGLHGDAIVRWLAGARPATHFGAEFWGRARVATARQPPSLA